MVCPKRGADETDAAHGVTRIVKHNRLRGTLLQELFDDAGGCFERAAIIFVIAMHEEDKAVFFQLLLAKGVETPPGGAAVLDMGRGPDVACKKEDVAPFECGSLRKFQVQIGDK